MESQEEWGRVQSFVFGSQLSSSLQFSAFCSYGYTFLLFMCAFLLFWMGQSLTCSYPAFFWKRILPLFFFIHCIKRKTSSDGSWNDSCFLNLQFWNELVYWGVSHCLNISSNSINFVNVCNYLYFNQWPRTFWITIKASQGP